ncbi:MAG: hypothetical protein ACI84O_001228 [Myxococcota bacterium]|jgi:hypothetical protein
MPNSDIIELDVAEQIVVVKATTSLAMLQKKLVPHKLMLGVMHDPDGEKTLHDLLMHDSINLWQGAYGYLRDQVLGARWLLADGKTINSGARVVKSVAGYDLTRLLLGSRNTLAKPLSFTLRLRPLCQRWHYYRLSLKDYLAYANHDLRPTAAVADGMQQVLIVYHHQVQRDYLSAVDEADGYPLLLKLQRAFDKHPGCTSAESRPELPPHASFDWNSWQYPCETARDFSNEHLEAIQLALCPAGEKFSDV